MEMSSTRPTRPIRQGGPPAPEPMEGAPKWVSLPQCLALVATSRPCRGVAKLRWLEGCLLVSWGCLRPCWRHRMAGPPVCRLPWDPPRRPAVMRCGRSSWMHMYRTVGRRSRVTRALRMCVAVDAVTAGSTSASEWLSTVTGRQRTVECRRCPCGRGRFGPGTVLGPRAPRRRRPGCQVSPRRSPGREPRPRGHYCP